MSDVQGYADRIATGLRYDNWPNQMEPVEARLAASVYGVDAPHQPATIREVSLLIAQSTLGGGR